MECLKVLIIGCGPAGSSTAQSILETRQDVQVKILERRRRIGFPPRCAGGISKMMTEKLNLKIPEEIIASHVERFRIYSPDGNYLEINSKELGVKELGLVLYRDRFDQWMAEKAHELGAEIEKGKRWQGQKGDYDILVVADGKPEAERLGVKERLDDIHIGVQKTLIYSEHPRDLISIFLGRRLAPDGYCWIFPEGKEKVRAGLGIPLSTRMNPKRLLDRFIKKHIGEAEETGFTAGLIPTYKPPKTAVIDKTLYVGNAALQTDPIHGGGIANAIIAGRCAGKAIAEGDPSKYDVYWKRELYGENKRRYRLKRILYRLNDKELNMLVRAMSGYKPQSLSVGRELMRVHGYLTVKVLKIIKF